MASQNQNINASCGNANAVMRSSSRDFKKANANAVRSSSRDLKKTIENRERNQQQVTVSSSNLENQRVEKALEQFHKIYIKVQKEHVQSKIHSHIHVRAAMVLRDQFGWINTSRRLGNVPGIDVGDKFQSMAELNIIGLHRQFIKGIDWMEMGGMKVATSIVATDRYPNRIKSADTLIYSGQGGYPFFKQRGSVRDQRLEGGNLALVNSLEQRHPVRVIHGVRGLKASFYTREKGGRKIFGSFYVYDGLYHVENYWQQREETGKIVFKFCMKRIPGQPELGSHWAK